MIWKNSEITADDLDYLAEQTYAEAYRNRFEGEEEYE